MQTVYSLCYKQQLPAKPLVRRSRPGFRTTSWMLPCLRELHHNMQWKIILITLNSMGSTHRYVVLQQCLLKPGLSLRALAAEFLAEICSEIPPIVADFFLCVLLMLFLVHMWSDSPACSWTALPNIVYHSSAVPRLSYNKAHPSDWTS